MMLPTTLSNHIQASLFEKTGKPSTINKSITLSGGDINDACRIETDSGVYFVKYNSATRFPAMFEKEARGLAMLQQAAEVNVPSVVATGTSENYAYLVLEYLSPGMQRNDFWVDFGKGLSRLHRHSSGFFGLDHDNYIGSLPQLNHKHDEWTTFFITERLERQLKMALDHGLVSRSIISKFEKLFSRLAEIFPVEPSSLVHGDLWSGNYMTGPDGRAAIIDPAVYYGHREMDIGMSRLFGGFSPAFYESYNEEYPLEPGWLKRVEICNLYPLMVHVNLFGGSYVHSVESILAQF